MQKGEVVDDIKQNEPLEMDRFLPKVFFFLQILLGICLSFWIIFNNTPMTGDDAEHIHSAWLVHQGKVPYIDFFQHHNPLLWYLFAPLTGMFAYDLAIYDAVRMISACVMFITLYMSALIVKRFISQNAYALLITVASVFPSYVIYSGLDFRPDNYMLCCYISGIYFYFSYLEKQKVRDLILSFALMVLSFLFMQKIIFMLGVFGIFVLIDLYHKRIILNDFMKALIFPIGAVLLFFLWLLSHEMIAKYWLANYIFNLHIPDVYWGLVEKTKPDFYIASSGAFISAIYFILKGNKYVRLICVLWGVEAIQRFFYFSLDRHYYYLMQILNGMLIGAFVSRVVNKKTWISYIFIALTFTESFLYVENVYAKKVTPPYHRYVTPKYVLEATNRCDSVLNGFGLTYNLFNKDITYYWNLNGQLDVIGNRIGLAPLPNLNRAVIENLPRIIYTDPYWDERQRKNNNYVMVHLIDPMIRDKYYEQSIFVGMFILKSKYQNMRRCRYDVKTDSWNYYYKERP